MGIGDSPEETLRVDAQAASHRVRELGRDLLNNSPHTPHIPHTRLSPIPDP
ncbi:MAG: hypothetical protein KME28_16410 [Pelatocladus maniniholoensis HA4357-MV3]|uniref:Uncharacterized protein n=1 Tax=Pelatocladus maniniholoensis HA4357-MV3 TaxID=1117104 RepID=A0A9E3H969_9NOST|nr:hypothetical protein [Pelatocladus maniniholoensis HA4357-MV3]